MLFRDFDLFDIKCPLAQLFFIVSFWLSRSIRLFELPKNILLDFKILSMKSGVFRSLRSVENGLKYKSFNKLNVKIHVLLL